VTAPVRLATALSSLAHHQALRDGTTSIPGVELEWVDVPRLPDIFLRMCRDLEFAVCELSLMSYFVAREHGLPISAIPVVPRHQFHHGDFWVHAGAGITQPTDLHGKRVGTRSWTLTPGVWDRGILTDEYGVDLSAVTWVVSDGEHVRESEAGRPHNVVPATDGDLFAALASGGIDAGIAGSNARRQQAPTVSALFPDAAELDRAQYERTGIVPVFTVVAIHDRVLEGRPWLAPALYEGLREARRHGLQPDPTVARVIDGDGDQSPFGLEANRAAFDELLRLGRAQGILTRSVGVDDLFLTP
jgi:4,5-dihydroxyphthalate decarboxylase